MKLVLQLLNLAEEVVRRLVVILPIMLLRHSRLA